MSDHKSMVDLQIESIAEAREITVDEAAQLFKKNSEHSVDFDNLPKQNHAWTDRGMKFTCENAGHPYHEAWKVRKAVV